MVTQGLARSRSLRSFMTLVLRLNLALLIALVVVAQSCSLLLVVIVHHRLCRVLLSILRLVSELVFPLGNGMLSLMLLIVHHHLVLLLGNLSTGVRGIGRLLRVLIRSATILVR